MSALLKSNNLEDALRVPLIHQTKLNLQYNKLVKPLDLRTNYFGVKIL